MKLLIFLLLMSVCVLGAIADPGPTDENEGHYNRRTGEYHYHKKVDTNTEALQALALVEAQAVADAKRDIDVDNVWFGYGLCCGIVAIGSAYLVTPTVPADKLIGKSPEYVLFYTKAYQDEMKKERAKAAAIGCGVGASLYVLLSMVAESSE